ncbi:hypothetical protein DW322_03645 [Rhodococcus rhodnii]|uniref:Uncharacterized protein n=2 Tax=Rhodococcus rhodnii TaxID=38312 RepID=R7WRJ8_9NOCA|nr:hypothetical protein Rrhod_1996 [Rhodococcus rhodnii LMG 5362]TXG89483.1 hypothetical protein DW322_03645 [Rhodococcus rhodnii]
MIYTGPDEDRGIFDPATRPPVLSAGHPGRIVRPDPAHVIVEWVGLEREPISQGSRFCVDRSGRPAGAGAVPGPSFLSENDYEPRRAAIIADS